MYEPPSGPFCCEYEYEISPPGIKYAQEALSALSVPSTYFFKGSGNISQFWPNSPSQQKKSGYSYSTRGHTGVVHIGAEGGRVLEAVPVGVLVTVLEGVPVPVGVDVLVPVLEGVPVPVGVLEGVIVGEGVKHWPSGKIHWVPTTEPPWGQL